MRLACAIVLALTPFGALAEDYTEDEIVEIANDYGLDAAPLMLGGDPDYGAYLAGECTTCHQTSGSYDGIPVITGWDALFFKIAMHEYRAKQRENPVMQTIAARLGDEEIASLAAYFATLEE
ncbi:MAG: hypothetical protein AAGM84_08595 [Pseudomonadota bacterium]